MLDKLTDVTVFVQMNSSVLVNLQFFIDKNEYESKINVSVYGQCRNMYVLLQLCLISQQIIHYFDGIITDFNGWYP